MVLYNRWPNVAALCLVFIVGFSICHAVKWNSLPEWDLIVFAQQWPETVCIDSNFTHRHDCEIPTNVTEWTIHGLWPTKIGTLGPNYCNSSSKFDFSKIKSIEPQLLQHWPNLYAESNLTSFWKHEYEKHGTCAASLPRMNSELKYFSTGLEVHHIFNFTKALESHGIVQRDFHTYDYPDVLHALQSSIGGDVTLQCLWDKKSSTQYIWQVEVCLDKDLGASLCSEYKQVQMRKDSLSQSKLRTVKYFDQAKRIVTRTLGSTSPQPCLQTQPIAYPVIKH